MFKLTKPALRTVVTGGSGALGSAIVAASLARGDRVVNLDRVASENAHWVEVDFADTASVARAVDEAANILGGIDVLIHSAGIFRANEFLSISDTEFSDILNINLLGSFRIAQQVASRMVGTGGRILLMSSIHAKYGVRGRLAYGASKAGIEAITRVMATELSAYGIRVNALAPGAVSAGMVSTDTRHLSDWISVTPAKRKVTPQEVAGMTMLLTGDDASFVSGQVISQDGGASISHIF
ncbi:SDR family NAD(P)-dependent oxidoreductase [Hoeflea alexandrii]|uniref:SDR family NAD(P)-dependent oxidoreductase n=1 Tax=Hoeflea alexandrii TaxID=288436 RepID=UPI0022B06C33|nr:SDR family oxidoreductase [Hoeflea alexandrii]MCZ4291507.1 SDR family NAD(P)-dependent oxidoreductase [Hoeflea alexandrii]